MIFLPRPCLMQQWHRIGKDSYRGSNMKPVYLEARWEEMTVSIKAVTQFLFSFEISSLRIWKSISFWTHSLSSHTCSLCSSILAHALCIYVLTPFATNVNNVHVYSSVFTGNACPCTTALAVPIIDRPFISCLNCQPYELYSVIPSTVDGSRRIICLTNVFFFPFRSVCIPGKERQEQ